MEQVIETKLKLVVTFLNIQAGRFNPNCEVGNLIMPAPISDDYLNRTQAKKRIYKDISLNPIPMCLV